jgi:hypothetical protein
VGHGSRWPVPSIAKAVGPIVVPPTTTTEETNAKSGPGTAKKFFATMALAANFVSFYRVCSNGAADGFGQGSGQTVSSLDLRCAQRIQLKIENTCRHQDQRLGGDGSLLRVF